MSSLHATYSTKELQKKLKKQQVTFVFHGLIIVLLFAVFGYKTFMEGFSFQSILPFFFIPIQIYIWLDIKNLKKELATRKTK